MNSLKSELLANNHILKSKLRFCTHEGWVFYYPEEIVYCEADQNYTYLHIRDGSSMVYSRNIGTLEKRLKKHGFFRISRSALINLRYLKSINRQKKICTLETGRQYQLKTNGNRIRELELF